MSSKAALVRESVNCIRSKFYGVYQLLSFKTHKLYGANLEDILAKDSVDTYTVLKSLVGNCTTTSLIFRECASKLKEIEPNGTGSI